MVCLVAHIGITLPSPEKIPVFNFMFYRSVNFSRKNTHTQLINCIETDIFRVWTKFVYVANQMQIWLKLSKRFSSGLELKIHLELFVCVDGKRPQ